jgi:hypothetical protein
LWRLSPSAPAAAAPAASGHILGEEWKTRERREGQAAASMAGLMMAVVAEKQLRMKTGKRRRHVWDELGPAVRYAIGEWKGGSEGLEGG